MLNKSSKIHFIGIGGIGMSALAQVLLSKGYIITGSDIKHNLFTRAIELKGGRVFMGHDAENITGSQLVVYSSAISDDNPELNRARKENIEILHRGRLLGELMNEKDGVAVTGSHGKTTTSAMISCILIKAGYDPVCLLGGESIDLNGNVYVGKGKFLVAEADESDSSHLYLEPKFALITNIDREHMDHYRDMDHIVETNLRFLERIKPDGAFFGSIDNEYIRKILLHYERRFATYGLSREADLYASNIRFSGISSTFDCIYKKSAAGTITLGVPGMHNVLNALGAVLFSLHIGIDFKVIAKSLYEFRSTKRRFEIYPNTGDVTLVEDYAHHPTEIKATLEACRLLNPRRVIAVFQPHRYTRTKELKREFGSCFEKSDELILTNIYAASEKPLEGVSVKNIYDEVVKNGFGNAHIMPKENIRDYLYNTCKDGDLIAVMGAGDIGEVAKGLEKRLRIDEGKR